MNNHICLEIVSINLMYAKAPPLDLPESSASQHLHQIACFHNTTEALHVNLCLLCLYLAVFACLFFPVLSAFFFAAAYLPGQCAFR